MDRLKEEHRGPPARGLVIAAPASGSGKTVLTMGLAAALRARGQKVAVAKAGPDYIDPQFLAAAGAAACLNLDPWAMPPGELRARAGSHAAAADFLLLEGAMGLFDGAAGGGGSTAELAETLGLPVLLVVDASRQAQSIAATVHGFKTFRQSLKVCGVIATQVASDRHAEMVRDALGQIGLPYLGALRKAKGLALKSRHLGLIQAHEVLALYDALAAARANVEANVDLDRLVSLAEPMLPGDGAVLARIPPLGQRIAVARDIAFGFSYTHMLADWHDQGAQLSYFSPLDDEAPDKTCNAVFLPGGYPEIHAGRLAAATTFLDGLRRAASCGAVVYGECGGYMVLGQALIDADGKAHPMAGLLGNVTSFATRKRQLGYRQLENAGHTPLFPPRLTGHEFHYSVLVETGGDPPLFLGRDSRGTALGPMGGCRGNAMGSYAHIIGAGCANDDCRSTGGSSTGGPGADGAILASGRNRRG